MVIIHFRTRLHSQSHYEFINEYSIYWPIKLLTRVFEFSIKKKNYSKLSLDSEDGFHTGCQNISCQKQSFSGFQSPRWSLSIKVLFPHTKEPCNQREQRLPRAHKASSFQNKSPFPLIAWCKPLVTNQQHLLCVNVQPQQLLV